MDLVTLADIEKAVARVAATCLRTPVLPVAVATGRPDASQLWVKAESLQPTGAFKLRGATNAIAQLSAEQRSLGVVTHSSGNHGQAVAFAAAAIGAKATVVMPEGSPRVKIDATIGWGAEVELVPMAERGPACTEITERTGAVFIPPYDDPWVIAGQGTAGLELLEQVPDVDVVLVPVSGGGLISGIAAAVKAHRPQATVIGVEPELAGDLAEGFAAGERREWPTQTTSGTIADGLRNPAVGVLNWEHVRAYVDDVLTVSEDAIRSAMGEVVRRCRIVVEPSGAVAAAGYLEYADRLPPGVTVAVASGGNVEASLLASVLEGSATTR